MPKTEMLYIESDRDTEKVGRAGRLLRQGAVVALPTETVFALGVRADRAGRLRLESLLGRPADTGYTLHIGNAEDVSRYMPRMSLQAQKLVWRLWPGPLTVIFEPDRDTLQKLQNTLPPESFDVLCSEGTLAVRYPAHRVACAVLTEAVAPVIAADAAARAHDVAGCFDGRIDLIVDAPDTCRYGCGAAVVKASRVGLEVLCEGGYSRKQIFQAASVNILFVCTGNTCRSPMAEALCRKYLADKLKCGLDAVQDFGYTLSSAGVAAFEAMPASRHALEVSRQKGSPLNSHRSRGLTPAMIQQADLIFAMNQSHKQAVSRMDPAAETKCFLLDDSGAIADPAGYDEAVYHACAEQIERCIQERMNKLL